MLALAGCNDRSEPLERPPSVVTSEPKPEPPPPSNPEPPRPIGLDHAAMRITTAGVDAEVFIADLTKVRLVALDARASDRSNAWVGTLRSESDAMVVVNGTFFATDGKPLGLLRQDDEELSPLRQADWGVLEVDGTGRVRLVHTKDYVPSAEVEFAVQCGPRVVIEGKVPSLKPQSAHRTALCVRSDHEVAVLVTRGPVRADALGTWLAAPVSDGGLGCSDALLLDGGPSTQLSARVGPVKLDIRGGWGVPNGVGIVARSKT